MSKFVERVVGRSGKQGDRETAQKSPRENPAEDLPAVARLSHYTARPDSPEDSATGAPQVVGQQVQPNDYASVGDHVTAVLEAANQAAAKIRDDARSTAREIGKHAQQEASRLLEKARAETEELSHDASRLRSEAEEQSRELKERADAYATEKRREADRQASALVARATRDASEHMKAAQDRGAALAKNVELSERRLQQLVDGLRDLAVRLEELLQHPATSADGAGVETREGDESTEESLRRSAAAQRTSQVQK